MKNLCNTLLPIDRLHTIPADIGETVKPIPTIDRVIEVDVAPITITLSTDSNTVFRVLCFFCLFFLFVVLVCEVCDHLFNVVDVVIKTVNVI